MTKYNKIQLIAYGSVTSEPTQVLAGPDTNQYRKDAEFRARHLCSVANWVEQTYRRQISDRDTLKLFVVPEFYFRFGGPSDPTRELLDSYPNGEILLPNITEEILKPHFADPKFADWLIVAGTMFWHKPAADSGRRHATYFNTVLVLRGGPDTMLTAAERDANRNPMNVPTMGAASTNQKSLMSQIDYALKIDNSQWDAAINPMFRLILEDWDWWRWHMFKVHGVDDPQGRPLVFGLEVCLEHTWAYAEANDEAGVLRTLRENNPTMPDIDVQVVTSCGMSINPATGVEARVGGYAILCDGMQPAKPECTPWPRAEHDVVVSVNTNTQLHLTAPVATVLARNELPAHLQLGLPGSQHDPLDAVSLWSPARLDC